ncbi:MAG: hypothetical protein OEU74_08995, partial [Gammaproteobacteria bacterium]|nr:hypothetical protein [Gammaproteobacteria bacterium]
SNVAARLSSLQRTMLDFDPLQHHGWFVLVESDLRYYCDAYFPVELFKHARSLLKTNGTHLDIAVRNSETENRDVFNTVAMSVINKTASYPEPMNLYQLKSLLSEFMLLPALYLQAAQGAGVFKKYSYGLAKEDFSAKEWEIMDEVSAIRSEWVNKNSYTMNVLLSLNLTARIILGRKFSSAIPSNIHSRMTRDFYRRIHALAASMHVKINGIAP